MGLFGSMGGVLGSSGSVFLVIVLAAADHMWGENVFNCPCGDYRVLYTSAYIVVPPVVIISIDTSWRVLFSTFGQCCVQFRWRCMRCCCCSRKICEMLVRLTIRPVIITFLWIVFSTMEPRFSRCMFKRVACNCTEDEIKLFGCTEDIKRQTALVRVAVASSCLALTCLAGILCLLFLILRKCIPCTARRFRVCCMRKNCCYTCADTIATHKIFQVNEIDDPQRQLEVSRCLYALGLEPKTLLKLNQEELLTETRIASMTKYTLRDIRFAMTAGQQEILMLHRQDIRVVKWLLQEGFKPENIRALLQKASLFGSTIENIRTSLELKGRVEEADEKELVSQIHRQGLGSLLPHSYIVQDYTRGDQRSRTYQQQFSTSSDKFVLIDHSDVEKQDTCVMEEDRGHQKAVVHEEQELLLQGQRGPPTAPYGGTQAMPAPYGWNQNVLMDEWLENSMAV